MRRVQNKVGRSNSEAEIVKEEDGGGREREREREEAKGDTFALN
jgi:hypothetical protein